MDVGSPRSWMEQIVLEQSHQQCQINAPFLDVTEVYPRVTGNFAENICCLCKLACIMQATTRGPSVVHGSNCISSMSLPVDLFTVQYLNLFLSIVTYEGQLSMHSWADHLGTCHLVPKTPLFMEMCF